MLSDGLLGRAAFDDVHDFLRGMYKHSGDGMAFEAAWHVLGVGPTVPGTPTMFMLSSCGDDFAQHTAYSRCHPGVHVFDPHWGGTEEPGGDPLGTLTRLHAALHGDAAVCDDACRQHLLRVVSVHIRGRVALQRLREAGDARGVLRLLAGRFAEARGLLALVDGDGAVQHGDYLAGSYLMMILTRMFGELHDAADAEEHASWQGVGLGGVVVWASLGGFGLWWCRHQNTKRRKMCRPWYCK